MVSLDEALKMAVDADNLSLIQNLPRQNLLQPMSLVDSPSPLLYALRRGSINCVNHLLTVPGIDVNATFVGEYGLTYTLLDAVFYETSKRFVMKQALTSEQDLPDKRILIDLVNNPSANINQTLAFMDEECHELGVGRMSLLISAIQSGNKELFDTLIDKPQLDLSFVCTLYGRNALHYAMKYGARSEVTKLMGKMSINDVNRACRLGLPPCEMIPINKEIHAQMISHILKSPKLKISKDMLSFLSTKSTNPAFFKHDAADAIDALLAHPNFNLDGSTLTTLLMWTGLDQRVFRADVDDRGMVGKSILHEAMKKQFSIAVFKQMMKFATLSDEISAESLPNRQTAVMKAVSLDRDDLLQLFLETTTDHVLGAVKEKKTDDNKSKKKQLTPLQMAKRLKKPKCENVIRSFARGTNAKITVVDEKKTIFDCR